MLTEQAAADYADATDGCRPSLVGTRDNARLWQRAKPDPETNPLAEIDWEKEPTWHEPLVTTPLLHLCSGRIDCTALAIQPRVPFAQPSETDPVAAV